jgi:hypothetical protein
VRSHCDTEETPGRTGRYQNAISVNNFQLAAHTKFIFGGQVVRNAIPAHFFNLRIAGFSRRSVGEALAEYLSQVAATVMASIVDTVSTQNNCTIAT